jgi:hypothetical protein
MDTTLSASPTGTRPYNALLLTVFAILAPIGLWTMRITTFLNDAPVGFTNVVAAGVHPNGVSIKKSYTGLAALDEGLSFLTRRSGMERGLLLAAIPLSNPANRCHCDYER